MVSALMNSIAPSVRKKVKRGANVYKDAFAAYRGLFLEYHQVVDHAAGTAYKKLTGNGEEDKMT